MNEVQIFNNPEFGKIRTVMINGDPWFVGKDVAVALKYKDTSKALSTHVDNEDKRLVKVGEIPTLKTGSYGVYIINESGLYSLIFGSKLESAKKFKRWVTSEVLPSIRKTGTYGQPQLPQTTDEKIALLAQGHMELKEEIDSVKRALNDFKQDMPVLGIEEDRITNAVKSKGAELLGGKKSNAYNDKSLRGKLYSDIYRELKRQFGVSTYKAIKRSQCEAALSVVAAYTPPMVLAEQISNLNAQMSMEGVA